MRRYAMPILASGAVAFVVALADPPSAKADAFVIETIALQGDVAPDVVGRTFRLVTGDPIGPDLNANGEVVFTAVLDPPGFPLRGVWGGMPGDIRLIALEGDEPPGVAGQAYFIFRSEVVHNDAGQLALRALLDNDLTGIWFGPPDGLALVALEGEPAPDTTARSFVSLPGAVVLNKSGVIAFEAQLDGDAADDRAIWVGPPGNLQIVARKGDLAPDTTDHFADFFSAELNDAGQVAIVAALDSDSASDRAIFAGLPGDLHLVAREGGPAPGGLTFGEIPIFVANFDSLGNVGFIANLAAPPESDASAWVGSAGALQLVAREGEPAPEGETFQSGINLISLTSGNLTLQTFDPSNFVDQRLYAGPPGGLELVARSGDPAPEIPGRTFGRNLAAFVNASGYLVLEAVLDGDDFEDALWFGRPGELELVMREGDMIDGWVVQSPDLLGGTKEDGRVGALNKNGQFTVNDQGGFASFLVTPITPLIEHLIDTIAGFSLPRGAERPLLKKLEQALKKVNDGNPANDGAAMGIMTGVLAVTKAKRGKPIPAAEADQIVAEAEAIVHYLEML